MSKKILILFSVLILLFGGLFVACDGGEDGGEIDGNGGDVDGGDVDGGDVDGGDVDEEPIILTYASGYTTESGHGPAEEPWLDYIEEATDGRVQFERFWGGTVITNQEAYSQIAAGICDVGHMEPAWKTYDIDVRTAMQVFFVRIPDREMGLDIFKELEAMFPEIKAEVSEVKVLGQENIAPSQLISGAGNAVRTLDDFSGKQIRTWGGHTTALSNLGASPISMSSTELYQALQKGTVDNATAALDMLSGLSLYEVVESVTMIGLGPCPDYVLGMNWDTWNSLPADIQQIFDDSYDMLGYEFGMDAFNTGVEAAFDLIEANDIEVIYLSEEDQEAFYAQYDVLAEAEAQRLDDLGLPGTEIWEALQDLMVEYGLK